MEKAEYARLLKSLAEDAKTIEVNGVPVQVRSCADRLPGRMDPRTQRASLATREEFRANKQAFDAALWANEEKLFGPERPEFGAEPVNEMRFRFGWRSADVSAGVAVKRLELHSGHGAFTVWQYEVPRQEKARPCLVFIHGGGFVAGDTATVENQCKLLAQLSGAVVLSVDYPLAPENKYPVGFDACWSTVKWAYENAGALGVSREKIGVSGDSAGGNFSLACALRDRDERTGYIRYQALLYPLLSRAFGPQDPHYYWDEQQYENPEGNAVIAKQIRDIGEMAEIDCAWYVPKGTDRFHPYISPITGDCTGLPQTLMITAEYDFLRAECDAYLGRLKDAGVPVRAIRYGGIFHGTFDRLGYAPQVEDIIREIAQDLQKF